jgi:LmbE family N-acetylglucosaminyl deacetylase
VSFSILAIGAHPDDIELGCGASLAKYANAGARIRAIVMSKGRRGALDDTDRAAETARSFEKVGIVDSTIYDFDDTNLAQSLNEIVATIATHLEEFAPTRVYTMFEHDRHQDHRAVYEASAVACRHVPQLLGYETPSSYPNFRPTLFEDIGDFLEQKVAALQCHESQRDRLYMQEDKVRAAAHFRGVQVDRGPCEGFLPYKMML